MSHRKVKKSHDQKIREKVTELIAPLIPEEDLEVDADDDTSLFERTILSEEAMVIWRRAFVHKSISALNYDVLEKIGDKLASTVFLQWLHKKFPDENSPQFFSEANSMYGNKDYFYKFADEWNLVPIAEEILPAGIEITDKEKSDLFESFVGATLNVIDDYYLENLGYGIVYKLITPLFETLSIDPSHRESYVTKRTQLKEWFDEKYGSDDKYLIRVGRNMIRPKPIYRQEQTRLVDPLTRKTSNFFVSTVKYPSSIKNGSVIAVGDPKRRITDAQEDAASKAVEKLGVTYEKINKLKEAKYQRDYGEAIKFLAEQGIDAKFDVIQEGEAGNNVYILVMKVRDDESNEYITVDTLPGLRKAQLRGAMSKLQSNYLESKGLSTNNDTDDEIVHSRTVIRREDSQKPKRPGKSVDGRPHTNISVVLAKKAAAKTNLNQRQQIFTKQRGTTFKK